MAFCKKCGAELGEGKKFCTRCGAPRTSEEVKSVPVVVPAASPVAGTSLVSESTPPRPMQHVSKKTTMEFKLAHCPSCGGTLQLPDDEDQVKCMYCGSNVVREAIQGANSGNHQKLLALADTAAKSDNHKAQIWPLLLMISLIGFGIGCALIIVGTDDTILLGVSCMLFSVMYPFIHMGVRALTRRAKKSRRMGFAVLLVAFVLILCAVAYGVFHHVSHESRLTGGPSKENPQASQTQVPKSSAQNPSKGSGTEGWHAASSQVELTTLLTKRRWAGTNIHAANGQEMHLIYQFHRDGTVDIGEEGPGWQYVKEKMAATFGIQPNQNPMPQQWSIHDTHTIEVADSVLWSDIEFSNDGRLRTTMSELYSGGDAQPERVVLEPVAPPLSTESSPQPSTFATNPHPNPEAFPSYPSEPDGFRGIKWGTSMAQVDGLIPIHGPGEKALPPGVAIYSRINDDHQVSLLMAKNISYVFKDGKFVAAIISLAEANDPLIVVNFCNQRYGPPTKEDQNRAWWVGPVGTVFLVHVEAGESRLQVLYLSSTPYWFWLQLSPGATNEGF